MSNPSNIRVGTVKQTLNGYYRIKLANSKWEFEHRHVMEQALGRPLKANERVVFRNKTPLKHPTPDDLEIKLVSEVGRSTAKKKRSYLARRVINLRGKLAEAEKELAYWNTRAGRPADDVSQAAKERE